MGKYPKKTDTIKIAMMIYVPKTTIINHVIHHVLRDLSIRLKSIQKYKIQRHLKVSFIIVQIFSITSLVPQYLNGLIG